MHKQKMLLVLTTLSVFLSGCSNRTELKSFNIIDCDQRVETLSKEVPFSSSIEDAEYDLFNVNGFSGDFSFLPGASASFYQFAVKVKPNEIHKWKSGLVQITGNIEDELWINKLTNHRKKNWVKFSKPAFFTRTGSENSVKIVIYEREGMIFKQINMQ